MIDSQTNIKLIERFSPKGSLLDKHHQRLLEILIYFDKICRENNIRYWLSSGTALGAVRHGGFIPWDDDADVEMLREDFEKLKAIFQKKMDMLCRPKRRIRFMLLRMENLEIFDLE